MAKMDERADIIGSSILAQAEHERKELVEKAAGIREHEMGSFEEQVIQDMFGKVQKQAAALRQSTVKSISAAKVTAHRELMLRREELMGRVFAAVRARLVEYAGTSGCREAVLDELKSIAASYDHSASTVFLRETDMGLAEEITGLLKGCAVKEDKTIKCGGWKLENSAVGIMIDETLDSRLEEQKPWFLLNSGLTIGRKG